MILSYENFVPKHTLSYQISGSFVLADDKENFTAKPDDFSEPFKIDLEAFMNQNYRYNLNLNRFAYLTERSLATFKRDFEKIFHISSHKLIL